MRKTITGSVVIMLVLCLAMLYGCTSSPSFDYRNTKIVEDDEIFHTHNEGDQIIYKIVSSGETYTHAGVRVTIPDGWTAVRALNTTPGEENLEQLVITPSDQSASVVLTYDIEPFLESMGYTYEDYVDEAAAGNRVDDAVVDDHDAFYILGSSESGENAGELLVPYDDKVLSLAFNSYARASGDIASDVYRMEDVQDLIDSVHFV